MRSCGYQPFRRLQHSPAHSMTLCSGAPPTLLQLKNGLISPHRKSHSHQNGFAANGLGVCNEQQKRYVQRSGVGKGRGRPTSGQPHYGDSARAEFPEADSVHVIYDSESVLVVSKPCGVHPSLNLAPSSRRSPDTSDSSPSPLPSTADPSSPTEHASSDTSTREESRRASPLRRSRAKVPSSMLPCVGQLLCRWHGKLGLDGEVKGGDRLLNVGEPLESGVSGIYVIAKGRRSQMEVEYFWATRRISRIYLALLHGHAPLTFVHCRTPICKPTEGCEEGRVANTQIEGKLASSLILPLIHGEYLGSPVTLAELRPITDRRHQLRLHTMVIGHPIVGDRLYLKDRRIEGRYSNPPGCPRLMLHSWRLRLHLPPSPSPSLSHTDLLSDHPIDLISPDPLSPFIGMPIRQSADCQLLAYHDPDGWFPFYEQPEGLLMDGDTGERGGEVGEGGWWRRMASRPEEGFSRRLRASIRMGSGRIVSNIRADEGAVRVPPAVVAADPVAAVQRTPDTNTERASQGDRTARQQVDNQPEEEPKTKKEE
ncbi:unnamed protein product [Vitrella brassicaformis CCMP3155]|uniref:Pseudouridine synthase RsuA/RluA-like domain-containing protein n=2 Tax=Vitrella brassicaformis TaxID=1169539 RepID=A0A0G4EMH8_VITBC|nr:unnamed protein product [Vitrella brassicaformis CCMP3155]|eukprot:CEL98211.1 unnamed protein product [Vitrella brassicaformis CCMP3155]